MSGASTSITLRQAPSGPEFAQATPGSVLVLNADKTTCSWQQQSNAAAQLVPAWFVNAATPAPTAKQDGLTAATAFATAEQLSQALSPGGLLYWPKQPTVLNFAAGAYNDFFLHVTTSTANPINVNGAFSASAPITLDGGTVASNAATSTRGQLSTAAGVFVAKARIRVTSGAAAGAVTYAMELNGDAQHVFVKPFFRQSDSSTVFPAAGDTVVVETPLTTLNRIDVNSSVLGNAGGGSGSLFFNDLAGMLSARIRSAGVLINLVECAFPANSQFVSDGIGITYINCVNVGTMTINSYGHVLSGHANQGTISCVSAQIRFNASCASDAGRLSGNSPSITTQVGLSSIVTTADYELENGAGLNAVLLGPGCQFEALGRMWGAAASPYATKSLQTSGAWFYYAAAANITFSSAVDFSVTGHNVAIGGTPIGYPRANCGVALTSDPAAVGVTV